MKQVKVIFMAAEACAMYCAGFLAFHYCEWYVATFITLLVMLAVVFQKEQQSIDWNEDEEEAL